MAQDIYPDQAGNGLSMDWMNCPSSTLNGLETRPVWLYMIFDSLYTGRHLTNAEDILPASEGVAGRLRAHMHGDRARLLYGLPPSHFDLASAMGASERPETAGALGDQQIWPSRQGAAKLVLGWVDGRKH